MLVVHAQPAIRLSGITNKNSYILYPNARSDKIHLCFIIATLSSWMQRRFEHRLFALILVVFLEFRLFALILVVFRPKLQLSNRVTKRLLCEGGMQHNRADSAGLACDVIV